MALIKKGSPASRVIFAAILGIALLLGGFVFLKDGQKTKDYVSTIGIVTECEHYGTSYDVKVAYEVDGTEYFTTFSFEEENGTFYGEGSELELFYDPSNPSEVTNSKVGSIIPIILMSLGGIALLYAVACVIFVFIKSK